MTGILNPQALFVEVLDQNPPTRMLLKGREAWAFAELHKAGEVGCTPITRPAPRWSAYIHRLRRYGMHIESVTEPHGGPYAGNHCRYILRSSVAIIPEVMQ